MSQSFTNPALFTKAPWEELDYTADYTQEMQRLQDQIASSEWVVPSNQVDGPSNSTIPLADGVTCSFVEPLSPTYSEGGTAFTPQGLCVAVVSGGTLGKQYRIQNNIVTAAGRRYSRQMLLTIAYR